MHLFDHLDKMDNSNMTNVPVYNFIGVSKSEYRMHWSNRKHAASTQIVSCVWHEQNSCPWNIFYYHWISPKKNTDSCLEKIQAGTIKTGTPSEITEISWSIRSCSIGKILSHSIGWHARRFYVFLGSKVAVHHNLSCSIGFVEENTNIGLGNIPGRKHAAFRRLSGQSPGSVAPRIDLALVGMFGAETMLLSNRFVRCIYLWMDFSAWRVIWFLPLAGDIAQW